MQNNGVNIIIEQLKTTPQCAGVYRMFDKNDKPLYVGKAKNLKKRISNYTSIKKLPLRLQRMVMQTHKMEVTTTKTESEALLLESNLIKELKPRYNILLRDDKSFPYIKISNHDQFPRITKYRGEKKKGEKYFGPFPSVDDVMQAISLIQKIFLLRPCSDNQLKNSKKPCLEYQMKRCCAPCVNLVSESDYKENLHQAEMLLKGRDSNIKSQLKTQMKEASKQEKFEIAATYRDRLNALESIIQRQNIHVHNIKNADIIALARKDKKTCIQIFFIRGGKMIGNKPYFPSRITGYNDSEIIENFMGNFYQEHKAPSLILVNTDLFSKQLLETMLSQKMGFKVQIIFPIKGKKRAVIEMVAENAQNALL